MSDGGGETNLATSSSLSRIFSLLSLFFNCYCRSCIRVCHSCYFRCCLRPSIKNFLEVSEPKNCQKIVVKCTNKELFSLN